MKVSVIIPLYNREATIGQALRSVLEQSVPPNEVIVVDDGSVDGSADVVRALNDPRVRYFHQANAGAGAARNRGLDVAQGDWVALLDSDDWWLPKRLASAAAAVAADDRIDFLQANRLHAYPDGRLTPELGALHEQLTDVNWLLSGFVIKSSAVMIRRDLIERLQLRFPTDQRTCEDYHFFWRALMFARVVGYTRDADVMIRVLSDSLSRANSAAYLHKDNIKTLIEVRQWGRQRSAPATSLCALDQHLHWQFREYLLMMLRGGDFMEVDALCAHRRARRGRCPCDALAAIGVKRVGVPLADGKSRVLANSRHLYDSPANVSSAPPA